MHKEYEKLLKQNMINNIQLTKEGLESRKSLKELEDETHREMHDVNFWTCNCGSEYGDHEADKIMKCSCCGRMMCPGCEDQHGPLKFNRDRFGLCFKK